MGLYERLTLRECTAEPGARPTCHAAGISTPRRIVINRYGAGVSLVVLAFLVLAAVAAGAGGWEEERLPEESLVQLPFFTDKCIGKMGLVSLNTASGQAYGASSETDPAAEVLRLTDIISDRRDAIEAARARELESVTRTYRRNVAEIAPKDMFETELEYHTRQAREKSEIELQRVKSLNGVHRTHDALLREQVEPLIGRVRELLTRPDIIPRDAIVYQVTRYDPESSLFHGSLRVASPLMEIDALMQFPMKRHDARVLWRNRQSLDPRITVSLDVHSLNIRLAKFRLEDTTEGIRTTQVFLAQRPQITRPAKAQLGVVAGIRASAADLAERIAQALGQYGSRGEEWSRGVIAEYNRLVGEAKSVFPDDAFVQKLGVIEYSGNYRQAAGAVATAAKALGTYFTSFVASEAFKLSAADLAERIAQALEQYGSRGEEWSRGVIAEYNRLVGEAKSVFPDDAFVQGLGVIEYSGNYGQAAGAVATAAKALGTYFTSFVASEAFKLSAADLAERIAQALEQYGSRGEEWSRGVIAEYNRLVGEAKSVFPDDAFVQGLGVIEYSGNYGQAAGAVATAAKALGTYFTSFVASEAFKLSAADLAERIAQALEQYGSRGEEWSRGVIAEYNRLVGEAKSVFPDDAFVQKLGVIEYSGNYRQAAGAVATAARSLERMMANLKDVPIAVEVDTKPNSYRPLDYLPYSGRFSPRIRSFCGFSPDAATNEGWTYLHAAVGWNLPGLVSALLDDGADPNARGGSGVTPLHQAASNDNRTVAADLIVRGVAINAMDEWSWRPIHNAAYFGAREVAELLIGQGADINSYQEGGWTPLDIAIDREHTEVVKLLQRHGATCNYKC